MISNKDIIIKALRSRIYELEQDIDNVRQLDSISPQSIYDLIESNRRNIEQYKTVLENIDNIVKE